MKRHHPIADHHPHSIGQNSHPSTGTAPDGSHSRGGFPRPDSFSQSSSGFVSDAEHHQFYTKPPNLEAQWQWERERDKSQNNSNIFSSPREAFHEGGEALRSYYYRQKPESKHFEAQLNKEPMEQRLQESTVPSGLESLERKIMEEILMLSKDQYDAEDVEIKRHKDRIMEINARFYEKVMSLRSKVNIQREELLLKEAQLRASQAQQMGIRGSNQFQQMGNQYDYRDRMDFSGRSEVRAFPDGRGYGDGRGRFY